MYHQLSTANAIWEAGEVLNVGRCCQLATSRNTICKETFVEYSYSFVSIIHMLYSREDLRFNSALARYTAAV